MAAAALVTARTLRVLARPAPVRNPRASKGRTLAVVPRAAAKDDTVIDLSDEYAAVESMASVDDVLAYYNHQHETRRHRLADVMQTNLVLTSPDATLDAVAQLLAGPPKIEGLPVVDADNKLVGVVSGKDLRKGGATVKDVMSSPAIALKSTGLVSDAAILMIKHKFHRVPVVDDDNRCVGLVTRTDIFWALTQSDQEEGEESYFEQHGIAL